jgi:hypothetical protein
MQEFCGNFRGNSSNSAVGASPSSRWHFFFIKKLKELNAINKLKELYALQQHVDNLIGELEKLCR